jgi:hypothetical protein
MPFRRQLPTDIDLKHVSDRVEWTRIWSVVREEWTALVDGWLVLSIRKSDIKSSYVGYVAGRSLEGGFRDIEEAKRVVAKSAAVLISSALETLDPLSYVVFPKRKRVPGQPLPPRPHKLRKVSEAKNWDIKVPEVKDEVIDEIVKDDVPQRP